MTLKVKYSSACKIKFTKSEFTSFAMILILISLFTFSWGYWYLYFTCLVFLLRINFKYNKNLFNGYFIYFIIPNILILIHAAVSVFIYRQSFYIMRSINNFVLLTAGILIAYCLFLLHHKKVIKIILYAILSYYLVKLTTSLISVGAGAFMRNIFIPGSDVLTKWLEQHDVGLSIGLLVLYAIFYQKGDKGRKKEFLLSIIIFVLCWKKIAIGAFVVTAAFIFLFNRKVDKKNRLILCWGIAGVFICFAVVYLIQDNVLTNWMWAHGLNPMGRDNLYKFFSTYYEFSPTFFGRGSGFTAKLLTSGVTVVPGYINKIAALHSDILRAFIEYGFFGSMLWYSYYLIILPGHFKKINPKIREMLFVCALYSFIVYITDNTSNYFLFQMLYMLLPLCCAEQENQRNLELR